MSNALADLRASVGAALSDPDDDATVLVDVVDSVTPPAYLLVWSSPWLLPESFCFHIARLDVVCIAGRMDPAPGIEAVETMVANALGRLQTAAIPDASVTPPARFDVGGVAYLAARLTIEARVSVADYVPPTIPPGGGERPPAVWNDAGFTYDGAPV